ncbi:MAG TPA: hypothetical protein VIK63_06630 [Haloplasmataceae bacterium]
MSVEEKVLQVFQENKEPLRPGDVAEKAGLDKKEVDKAIKKLRAEGKIISPKRCYYTLAE